MMRAIFQEYTALTIVVLAGLFLFRGVFFSLFDLAREQIPLYLLSKGRVKLAMRVKHSLKR